GPNGVEMAGSISELAKRTLERDFRTIKGKQARVVLLDAAPKVLPMFDDELATSAIRQLEQLSIEVRVATKVLGVTPEGVQLENELIRARTVIWAAGNTASPLAKQLGCEVDRQGGGGRERPERAGLSGSFCDRECGQFFAPGRQTLAGHCALCDAVGF